MTPYKSFELFTALKSHFTREGYDFIKYRGKTFVKPHQFDKMKDRWFYHKLAERYGDELKDFYISVFIGNEPVPKWSGDMLDDKYDAQFQQYLKRIHALRKTFSDDVNTIVEFMDEMGLTFKELLVADGDKSPKLIRLYEQGYIQIESIIIINQLTSFVDRVKLSGNAWKHKKLLLNKYQRLFKVSEVGYFAKILRNGIEQV